MFQLDGAPANIRKVVQDWLEKNKTFLQKKKLLISVFN